MIHAALQGVQKLLHMIPVRRGVGQHVVESGKRIARR